MFVGLLIAAGCAAVGDWVAVARSSLRTEYLLKPLALALLVAAALVHRADPWLVAALVCGLAGDIGLMLSRSEEPDLPFLLGLGAFLAGHIAYLVTFARHGLHATPIAVGVVVVLAVAIPNLGPVLGGADRTAGRAFAIVVAAYSAVLCGMAVLAAGTGIVLAGVGGLLFLVSDLLIGRQQFLRPMRAGPVLIIVAYHLAQFGLLLALT